MTLKERTRNGAYDMCNVYMAAFSCMYLQVDAGENRPKTRKGIMRSFQCGSQKSIGDILKAFKRDKNITNKILKTIRAPYIL
jgi:hypothetical protein